MQRVDLPPPVPVHDAATEARGAEWVPDAESESPGARRAPRRRAALFAGLRSRLSGAHTAEERRRPLFHPARGWFRRLERAVSHALTRDVYPRIPGIHRPYGRLLRDRLTLSEASVRVRGLPEAFGGFRVLLITDVHAGPFFAPAVLRETFRRLLTLEPDLILLGGDLVAARLCEIDDHAAAFRMLRAPHGTFAVLGNHDHYTRQAPLLIQRVERHGVRVLHNRAVDLERDGQRLSLAGVDDLIHGRPDLDAALQGTRPPVILLSHNPDLLFEAARSGVALMLSGHTHAGQVRIRGLPVLVRQSRYRLDEGRYHYRGTELIVSRGLGAVALPLRVACPPEAVLLTLSAGS